MFWKGEQNSSGAIKGTTVGLGNEIFGALMTVARSGVSSVDTESRCALTARGNGGPIEGR
jgi:hypothetical protein